MNILLFSFLLCFLPVLVQAQLKWTNVDSLFGDLPALNLDGGGSSCLLVNGKNTIQPSDKGNQRPVPAVFMIKNKSF